MRKISALAFIFFAGACVAKAQMGRTSDWSTYGGDAQRTGWEKTDARFTKADVAKGFQFLWKLKPEGQQTGPRSLMAPVIIGNLIGYRGFKELAFIAGADDNLYVMDADLNRMYWQKHFEYSSDQPRAASSPVCPGGLTAMPTLTPGGFRRPPGARAGAPGGPGGPGGAPRPAGLFGLRSVYVISSDGKLHRLNVANGADIAPPVAVLPANAKASTLNIADNVLYTTTTQGCGGAPNAVWAIDISNTDPQAPPKVTSFVSNGGSFGGLGGPVIGNDGTIYVQTGDEPSDPASNKWSNTLLALTKELQVKQYFAPSISSPATKPALDMNVTTPVVFAYKNRDLIVIAGKDGRLYLLDSESLGGEDHRTPLYRTAPVSSGDNSVERGIWGGLSSWEDADGRRWVLAAVWGPLHADLKVPVTNGNARNGSIVAFKVEEQNGKPALAPAWVSRDMNTPAPPVIANGVVFAVSNGDARRQIHATLHALDAATGEELWSTRNEVTAPGNFTGLTIANGRLYFATSDNTIWVFGMPLEI